MMMTSTSNAMHVVIVESITIQTVLSRSQTAVTTMHEAMSNEIVSVTLKERIISFAKTTAITKAKEVSIISTIAMTS